jgi:hypothetical protein
MNEEFALLKSMIPACTGEMHKLAILQVSYAWLLDMYEVHAKPPLPYQASIEYLRYLEDCVAKLKAQHDDDQTRTSQLPSIREFHPTFRDDTADVDMVDDSDAAVSPTFTATPDHGLRQPSASPALYAQDAQAQGHAHGTQAQAHARGRQHSYSSVSTDNRHYSYSASAGTSPAFGPQGGLGSAFTSPALNPQSDLDQEATAALLMLNSDRRGISANAVTKAAANARGLSVRDLLTA